MSSENYEKQVSLSELRSASTEHMLLVLAERGGHPGILAEAALLAIRKSQDYNHGGEVDPHKVDRSAYFPFGTVSYAHMLHTKAMRFNSLTRKLLDGGEPNFEGLLDTALDLINYAAFYVEYRRENKGVAVGKEGES